MAKTWAHYLRISTHRPVDDWEPNSLFLKSREMLLTGGAADLPTSTESQPTHQGLQGEGEGGKHPFHTQIITDT